MFSRIFNINTRKEPPRKANPQKCTISLEDFQSKPRLPRLEKKQIRVLIFRDCERRSSKTLLFDSDAVLQKIPVNKDKEEPAKESYVRPSTPCAKGLSSMRSRSQPTSPCPLQSRTSSPIATGKGSVSPQRHQFRKPSSDVNMLGEMIFGSVAVVYKGSQVKVHVIRSPPQLMLTKVFALRSRSAGVNFCDGDSLCSTASESIPARAYYSDSTPLSSQNNSPEGFVRSLSTPLRMAHPAAAGSVTSCNSAASLFLPRSSASMTSLDSMNLSSSMVSLNSNASPCGSLKRRWHRSQITSLDSSQHWRGKNENSEELRTAYKMQPKIGIGIIFKLWDDKEENNRVVQDFFFTHYTLFDAHLQKMRVKIEKAFYLRKNFINVAIEATECFQEEILSLLYSPRIVEPVWLNLMIAEEHRYHEIIQKFVSSFINLVDICENKQTNYFLSTLLTAVLTHHVSWVATVMPTGSEPIRAYLDKHSSKTLDVLARCHPYNPLWAQLGDLYGSISSPLKLARTIVVGKHANLVCELLHILTYFIRCSDIKERTLTADKNHRFSGCSWGDSNFLSQSPSTPNSVKSWIEQVAVDERHKPLHRRSYMEKLCSDRPVLEQTSKLACEEADCDVDFKTCISPCRNEKSSDRTVGGLLRSSEVISFNDTNKLMSRMMSRNQHDEDRYDSEQQDSTIHPNCTSTPVCSVNASEYCSCVCLECMKLRSQTQYSKPTTKFQYPNSKMLLNVNSRTASRYSSPSHRKCNDLPECEDVMTPTNETALPIHSSDVFPPRKPSFVCYCCPDKNECSEDSGLSKLVSKATRASLSPLMLDMPMRNRNFSDPVDCISPKLKTPIPRHSMKSHDSGTEMEPSSCPMCCEMSCRCSTQVSRCPSIDSTDDQLEEKKCSTTDVDSDYSSLDNGGESVFEDETCSPFNKCLSSTTLQNEPLTLDFIGSESLVDKDLVDMHLMHLPLPKTHTDFSGKVSSSKDSELCTFGKSLLAGYCDSYVPDFVLQGTEKVDQSKLAMDLQATVKYSVIDEQISDAVCIIADTDTWDCELWTLARRRDSLMQTTSESLDTKPIYASDIVSSMIETTKELWDMQMPAHFCLLHLEEQLKDVYNRSKVLSEFAHTSGKVVTPEDMVKQFGYHSSDVELLQAVAATHSPYFGAVLVDE